MPMNNTFFFIAHFLCYLYLLSPRLHSLPLPSPPMPMSSSRSLSSTNLRSSAFSVVRSHSGRFEFGFGLGRFFVGLREGEVFLQDFSPEDIVIIFVQSTSPSGLLYLTRKGRPCRRIWRPQVCYGWRVSKVRSSPLTSPIPTTDPSSISTLNHCTPPHR